jgi:nicotinamidase/pyrazinamidase
MDAILRAAHVTHVTLAGLAFDYCVGFSALDAQRLGYHTTVVLDGCRSVAEDSERAMMQRLREAGVRIVNSDEV